MIPRITAANQPAKEESGIHRQAPRFLAPLNWLAFLFLGAFTMCLLWPLCIGRTLYWGDILLYFDPMNRFARHELLLGRLPLWNPYILCGQPFMGNPQINVIYPATLLLVLFPPWAALNISTLFHLFLCGACTFCFLRRWTVHTTPALAGACVYMGSACLLGRLQFPPMIQTAAYFPLLFAVLDRNIDRPSQTAKIGLALAVCLTLFAAHTQVAYLAFTGGIAYGAMRLWRRASHRRPGLLKGHTARLDRRRMLYADLRSLATRCAPLAAAAFLGLILAAIYLLPALQLLHESPREQMSIGQTNRFFTDAPHLMTLLFPRFAGHPASRDFWARGNAWEPAWFIGWIPLGLIGYAIARCNRENLVRFWSILVLVGIWLSLGTNGGLFWLCFYVVPGLSNFHDPARFLLWATLGFAVLTAVGMDAIRVRARWFTRSAAAFALAAILLPLWWFNRDWNPTTLPSALEHIPSGLDRIRRDTGQGRVLLPSNTVFWRHFVNDGYMDYGYNDSSSIATISDTLLSNLEMRYGLESASGYEPVPIAAQVAMEGLTRLAVQRREPAVARLMGLQNVESVLLPAWQAPPNIRLRLVNDPGEIKRSPLRLYQNQAELPRAWLTRSVKRVEGKMRLATALSDPDFDPLACTVVSGDFPGVAQLEWGTEQGTRRPTARVRWHRDSPITVSLAANAGDTPALLVFSATAYPGWKAVIDGRPATLCRADGSFDGILLPPGEHAVRIVYSPDVFRTGTYLSLIGAGILASLMGHFYWGALMRKGRRRGIHGER